MSDANCPLCGHLYTTSNPPDRCSECGEPLPNRACGSSPQPRRIGFFGRLLIELMTLVYAASAAIAGAHWGRVYASDWGGQVGLDGFAGRWLTHGGGLFLGVILGLLLFRWVARDLIRNLWGALAIFVTVAQACVRFYLANFQEMGVPEGWRPSLAELVDFGREHAIPVLIAGLVVGLLAKSADQPTVQ